MTVQLSSPVWADAQDGWFAAVNHASRATPWLHEPARLFAEYGVVVFAGILLLSWWLARRDRDLRRVTAALWAPVAALLALGLNQVLVSSIAEPRPYVALPHVLVLVGRSADPAFPSDHAVMAGAVAVGVLLANRTLGLVTVALAVLMAATRVYVGAHFPLDVVAGLLVGGAVAAGSHALVRPVGERIVGAGARTPARFLLTAPAAEASR